LIDQRKFDIALGLLQNTSSKNSLIYIWIGECYYQKNDFSSAISYFKQADSINKDISSLQLSRCFAQKHENSSAVVWLQKYLALNDKISEVDIINDGAFIDLSETKEWKLLWKQNWYSEMEASRNAIAALITKGKADDALNELESLRDKFFPKHEFFALQAKAYVKQNMIEPAIASLNEAISQYSRSDEYFALRANLLLKIGKYSNALDDITKAIHLNLYIPSYYLKRAEIARLAGDYQVADADLKIYQELYPDVSEAYHQYGLLEKARENYLNALDYYDRLIEKDKSNAQYFNERGSIALDVNQIQKADEDFGMALDINPALPDAYLNKGNTRLMLQDTEGACFYWGMAKRLGSGKAATLLHQHCKN